jgi:hypothetical protein
MESLKVAGELVRLARELVGGRDVSAGGSGAIMAREKVLRDMSRLDNAVEGIVTEYGRALDMAGKLRKVREPRTREDIAVLSELVDAAKESKGICEELFRLLNRINDMEEYFNSRAGSAAAFEGLLKTMLV